MQMKERVSSCRGGGERTPGPCHRDCLTRQGPYISCSNGSGSTEGARAAPGRTEKPGRWQNTGSPGSWGPGRGQPSGVPGRRSGAWSSVCTAWGSPCPELVSRSSNTNSDSSNRGHWILGSNPWPGEVLQVRKGDQTIQMTCPRSHRKWQSEVSALRH